MERSLEILMMICYFPARYCSVFVIEPISLNEVNSSNYTTIVLFRETVIEIKLSTECNFSTVGRKKSKTFEQDGAT